MRYVNVATIVLTALCALVAPCFSSGCGQAETPPPEDGSSCASLDEYASVDSVSFDMTSSDPYFGFGSALTREWTGVQWENEDPGAWVDEMWSGCPGAFGQSGEFQPPTVEIDYGYLHIRARAQQVDGCKSFDDIRIDVRFWSCGEGINNYYHPNLTEYDTYAIGFKFILRPDEEALVALLAGEAIDIETSPPGMAQILTYTYVLAWGLSIGSHDVRDFSGSLSLGLLDVTSDRVLEGWGNGAYTGAGQFSMAFRPLLDNED